MPDLGIMWDKPLSQGHLMKTEAHVRESDGLLVAQTRTRSVVLLGGFHGAVQAYLADADGTVIGKTDKHTFGVDGVWIGQHDRADTWSYSFPPELVRQARQITVVHTWDPQWLSSIENTIRVIVAIIEALSNSGKGNGGTGVAMAWPNRAPWTRPRSGRVIRGGDEAPAGARADNVGSQDDALLETLPLDSIDEAPWSGVAA